MLCDMKHPGYETSNPLYYGLLKQYASENRNNQTDAERLLWRYLSDHKLGTHFRRQHIIGCYIADFVCLKHKLIVEVDGGYHAQEQQKIDDYLRTEDLERMGFRVIRFRNEEIFNSISSVLDIIFDNLFKK